jgi:hypothetical protein
VWGQQGAREIMVRGWQPERASTDLVVHGLFAALVHALVPHVAALLRPGRPAYPSGRLEGGLLPSAALPAQRPGVVSCGRARGGVVVANPPLRNWRRRGGRPSSWWLFGVSARYSCRRLRCGTSLAGPRQAT